MKVAFITNYQDTCGVAVYGEKLVDFSSENVDYNVIPPSNWEFALNQVQDCNVIHINYHNGLRFGFDIGALIQRAGLPYIITNHNSEWKEPWYENASVIIVHRPVPEGTFKAKTIIFPQPVTDIPLEDRPDPGLVMSQAGFPFAWKNFPKICSAANELIDHHPSVYFVMPDTYHGQSSIEIQKCEAILDPSIPRVYETGWLQEYDLIRSLRKNASVMVWYTDGSIGGFQSEGPSASVRMGIATHLPVIVNGNATQYADILDEEGVYPVYADEMLAPTILKAYQEGKTTTKLAEKQSFYKVAQMYEELYDQVSAALV